MPAFPERRRKICARLAQDLVGLPELAVLALQRLQLLGNICGNAGALAAVDFGLLDPVKQRVCRAADLGRNRLACRPARGVVPLVIPRYAQSLRDQSDGALAHLGGKLVRRFACHGSILLGSWNLRQTGGGSPFQIKLVHSPFTPLSTTSRPDGQVSRISNWLTAVIASLRPTGAKRQSTRLSPSRARGLTAQRARCALRTAHPLTAVKTIALRIQRLRLASRSRSRSNGF